MILLKENPLPTSAIPIDAFRAHLRIGTATGADGLEETALEAILRAAIAAVETYCGRVLLTREFAFSLNSWTDPGRRAQPLPVTPVTAVTELHLIAGDGSRTVVARDGWLLEVALGNTRLCARTLPFPRIPAGGSAQMHLVAGMAPNWGNLPADLAQAVYLLGAHFYDQRGNNTPQNTGMPASVRALVKHYRPLRLALGSRG